MENERMVTRRVVESKEVKVYSLENCTLIPLATITVKGKISERELAKEYKVKKVVIDVVSEDVKIYGVTVSEFMKIATEIKKEETAQ